EDHVTGRAAAIALALALYPVPAHAQGSVLTVSVESADVHKGPSIATPVIGHLPRGTAMPVLRNLGSWVRVDWPAGPDGCGYLHVTTGRLSTPNGDGATATAARTASTGAPVSPGASSPPSSSSTPVSASASPIGQAARPPRPRREHVVVRSQQGGPSITH